MFLVVCTDIQLVRVVKNHHLHYKSCVSLLAEEYKYSAQSSDCPNPIVPERPAQKFHPKMKLLTLRTYRRNVLILKTSQVIQSWRSSWC